RMMSKMSGQRVAAESDGGTELAAILKSGVREKPDISALASLDRNKLCVMAWHYHDDDLPGPDADVELSLAGLPAAASQAKVEHYRIDADHSNSFTAWKKMDSPEKPTADQYAKLEQAGQLAKLSSAPESIAVQDGKGTVRFSLPRQAVSLV